MTAGVNLSPTGGKSLPPPGDVQPGGGRDDLSFIGDKHGPSQKAHFVINIITKCYKSDGVSKYERSLAVFGVDRL